MMPIVCHPETRALCGSKDLCTRLRLQCCERVPHFSRDVCARSGSFLEHEATNVSSLKPEVRSLRSEVRGPKPDARRSLPNLTSLLPTHHRRIRLATPRLLKLRQVRQRPNHAILRNRMRIALHHQPRSLRTNFIPAELPPSDKELLFRREPVNVRRTRLPF